MVLEAGQTRPGCSSCSTRRSFRLPQVGCLRRRATSSSHCSRGVACGHECGVCDPSSRPAGPRARNRASHLYPVFSLMPYCSHNAVNRRRRPRASATNSSRIDMTLGTLQGTATSWLCEKVHQPHLSPRSIPHPSTRSIPDPDAEGLLCVLRVLRLMLLQNPLQQLKPVEARARTAWNCAGPPGARRRHSRRRP